MPEGSALRTLVLLLGLALVAPAGALSPAGREFLDTSTQLEKVQCDKRKLRREYVIAQAEGDKAKESEARKRFDALDRDPQTQKLERRLGQLQQRMTDANGKFRDPEDLDRISAQQRRAFYDCE